MNDFLFFFSTDDPFNSFSRVVRSSLLFFVVCFRCVSFASLKMLQLQTFKCLSYIILHNK